MDKDSQELGGYEILEVVYSYWIGYLVQVTYVCNKYGVGTLCVSQFSQKWEEGYGIWYIVSFCCINSVR